LSFLRGESGGSPAFHFASELNSVAFNCAFIHHLAVMAAKAQRLRERNRVAVIGRGGNEAALLFASS